MEDKQINHNFEYDSLKDKLPSNIIIIIVGVSILAAIYLGFFVVV
jgi:hypothetical protein